MASSRGHRRGRSTTTPTVFPTVCSRGPSCSGTAIGAVVELKRHEADLFEQRLPVIRSLGLECERFGGRSFLIRSVPNSVGQEQLAGHLSELAHIAAEDSSDWQDRLLIGLACRSALRRGRELGLDKQHSLITSLANASAPAVCPHGSPILLHYSRTFLIDKFDW